MKVSSNSTRRSKREITTAGTKSAIWKKSSTELVRKLRS